MDSLFPSHPLDSLPDPQRPDGPFAGVALENSLDRVLDYAIPPKLRHTLQVGQRVKVPLGRNNKPAFGYVVSIHPTTAYPRIKSLLDIEDPRVLLNAKLLDLTRWMGRYYCTPLGTVIDNIIPSAVRQQIGVDYTHKIRLLKTPDQLQEILEKTRGPKRRAILARLLQLQPDQTIDLTRLASESNVTPPTIRKLAQLGLIIIHQELDLPGFTADVKSLAPTETDIQLNPDQQKAFDNLCPRLAGGFSVNLLFGVTGSGKTELYLQSIRRVIELGKQAIVLVPEIALTPQTVRRFVARCPRVAILHSGLSASARHRYWQQIAQGQADVIVGARSAIFAPVPNLGIIVVDEEHESSYKQDTAPRYHARDVAIKRAQLENIPILLGSATPSLEMYHRVTSCQPPVPSKQPAPVDSPPDNKQPATGNYFLLTLPSRVQGLQLPPVELIDMKQVQRIRGALHLISPRLEHLLRATIDAGHQAILLLNRRGYSNFVYCVSCQEPMQCKYCDVTMTYHRSASAHPQHATAAEGVHTGQLHCHYCLAVNPLPALCPKCNKKLTLFGLGTQRVEEELLKKIPNIKYARVDSDTMRSAKDYEALLERFGKREIQVMLGTQMIAKGLDYPNVTLVGVINGDTALSLPDFRSGERTFQLITQVAGRAGRGQSPGRVILQTFQPDDAAIRSAIKQDFIGFATAELIHRRDVGLPPFARMVRIILRDQDEQSLAKHGENLLASLNDAIDRANLASFIKLKGPMPCAISRIAGHYRHQIVLQSPSAGPLQSLLASVRDAGLLAHPDRIAIDVDPVSLL